MTWVALAVATAFIYALHGAWSKRVTTRTGPLASAFALFLFALPVLAAYLAFHGVPQVGARFWPVLAVNCFLNLAAAYLFLSALRDGDLGITFPLLALTPLFVVPVELVLLRELPRPWGGAGIGLVVFGIYLLNFSGRGAGWLAPVAAVARSPGARTALIVALLWSVTGTLDRVAVLESSPAFYGVTLSLGLSALFLAALAVARRHAPDRGGGASLEGAPGAAGPVGRVGGLPPREAVLLFAVHGLLFGVMFILQMEALRLALASYVLSIKRAGAILAVVLGWLAFREGALLPRIAGATVTVAGVGVLAIWG